MHQAQLHYVLAALTLVATAYSQSTSDNSTSVLGTVKEGIQNDISTVTVPVVNTIAGLVYTTCDGIKKVLGVSYEQLAEKNETDVDSLTLKYISRDGNESYNINEAARLISTDPRFNGSDELYIYMHGSDDTPAGPSFGNISEALYSIGIESVLALDAGYLVNQGYLRSSTNVRFIGEKMGEFFAELVQQYGKNSSMIIIIGHSLGAHMASFSGKRFTELTGKKFRRITGLDPALPCFNDKDLRIQPSDADYVDVIHTYAGVYGIKEPVGHADYYPNGGSDQPKCSDLEPSCHHARSWQYYAESVVNPDAFPAVKCDSWFQFKNRACLNEISYMGFPSNPSTRGKFYLQTAGEEPYGLGVNGTRYQSRSFIGSLLG